MDEVEAVALWLGILVGVAGIVLSVVAIWFANSVNTRSAQVSDRTLQSLQKIETTVERLSADTTGLIKAAWDKLIGQMTYPPVEGDSEAAAEEIASGVSSELQADLKESAQLTSAAAQQIQGIAENLEAALRIQMAARPGAGVGAAVDQALQMLKDLSPEAQELVRAIHGKHVTRDQYLGLRASPLSGPLLELRQAGLLISRRGWAPGGDRIPVYYLPNNLVEAIGAALFLLPDNPPGVRDAVIAGLASVGYESA